MRQPALPHFLQNEVKMSRTFKTANIILILLTALFLAGCGKIEQQKDTGKVEEGPAVSVTEAVEPTAVPTEAPKATATPAFTATPTPVPTHETKGLAEYYKDSFPIGVAVPNGVINNKTKYWDNILHNYNQITCENETKPDSVLFQSASAKGLPGTYLEAAIHFDGCKKIVEFCEENDIQMRLHTLVWHSQTPRWFFTEDYTPGGALVSRDVMLKRMENYIKDVLEYFDTNHPGLIYAVDVVNECFDKGEGDTDGVRMRAGDNENLWYTVVGADYYYWAFYFARKYAPNYMTLYYNDYGMTGKYEMVIKNLQKVKDEGLIDGIGMQSHLSVNDRIATSFMLALRSFCNAGYCVQLTELDIGVSDTTEASYNLQARKYKVLFKECQALIEKGYDFRGITLWGVGDGNTWRNNDYPLLFDKNMKPKPAYYGALQEDGILAME
jgi:GH35 family endo-1,4-beta-xylanase